MTYCWVDIRLLLDLFQMKFLRRPSSPDRALSHINRAFSKVTTQKHIDWKEVCRRKLKIPHDAVSRFAWSELYASSVDGSHAYSLHDSNRHIDRKRIGSFCVQSGAVLVSGHLSSLASYLLKAENVAEKMIQCENSSAVLSNVQIGGWIADLNLLKCSLCSDDDCEGTMQGLDVRHSELFLHEEYRKGEWTYQEIDEYYVHPPFTAVSVGILDAGNVTNEGTKELLDLEAWVYPPNACVPATMSTLFAAGASTNLDHSDDEAKGLVVKLYTMRAGEDGAIVAIRMTQCLAP
ncbi:hypothetical protein GOP47_0027444 [Adiantum capillus-veneris]|nr:hypothetical protein GOP47_0027444 [Adiantum capillus-veneris]